MVVCLELWQIFDAIFNKVHLNLKIQFKRVDAALASLRPPGASAHCSYLDIYISQKIRLCKGDFEGKFQTSVQASIMNFLV